MILSRQKIGTATAVTLIFVLALGIRFFSFYLQHWQGDQSQYVALAMKYDLFGMEGLNLEKIEIRRMVFKDYPERQFMFPIYSKDAGRGDFFRAYDQFGLQFNNLPLYHKSPLFPAFLAASHRLFAARGQPFVVMNTHTDFHPKRIQCDPVFLKIQFWAVIVPLASSLLTILLTFFLGKYFFNTRAALYAMFLMAIHPIDIVTSYKILSDNFVTVFVAAALFLFVFAHARKNLFFIFISGLVTGFAFLAKQSALLILPTVGLYLIYTGGRKWYDPRAWISLLKNPYFLWYIFGAVFISAHWFLKVYRVYGNPFYEPGLGEQILQKDRSGWFNVLSARPQAILLFLINIPLLCPPFIFGHWTFKKFMENIFLKETSDKKTAAILFLWFWVLPFVLFFTFRVESREERYLLPVYPALAMLSGYGLSIFQDKISQYIPKIAGNILISLFLTATIAWSVPVALQTVFEQKFLILDPMKCAQKFYKGIFYGT